MIQRLLAAIPGASPYGALDMAGNVGEWVNDWYDYSYYQHSPARNPTGPATGTDHILRGGSWGDGWWQVRSAGRVRAATADTWDGYIGFRCAAGTSP